MSSLFSSCSVLFRELQMDPRIFIVKKQILKFPCRVLNNSGPATRPRAGICTYMLWLKGTKKFFFRLHIFCKLFLLDACTTYSICFTQMLCRSGLFLVLQLQLFIFLYVTFLSFFRVIRIIRWKDAHIWWDSPTGGERISHCYMCERRH